LALLGGCTLGAHSHPTPALPAPTSAPPPVGSIDHPRPVECVDGTALVPGHSGPPPQGVPGWQGHPDPSQPTASSPSPSSTPSPEPSSAAPPAAGSSGSSVASSLLSGASPRASVVSSKTPTSPAGSGAGAAAGTGSGDVTVGPLTWHGLRDLAAGDQQAHGIVSSGGWHYRAGPDVAGGAVVTVTVGAEQRARAGLEFGGGYGNTPAPSVTFHSCPGSVTSFYGGFFVAGDGRACVPLDIRVGDGPVRRVVVSFFNGPCPA
jgi:hypothetical protein